MLQKARITLTAIAAITVLVAVFAGAFSSAQEACSWREGRKTVSGSCMELITAPDFHERVHR